jgi:hypothetical protein
MCSGISREMHINMHECICHCYSCHCCSTCPKLTAHCQACGILPVGSCGCLPLLSQGMKQPSQRNQAVVVPRPHLPRCFDSMACGAREMRHAHHSGHRMADLSRQNNPGHQPRLHGRSNQLMAGHCLQVVCLDCHVVRCSVSCKEQYKEAEGIRTDC